MNTFRFNVSFDATSPTPISIDGSDGSSFPLHAPEGISLITFTLNDANNSGAAFPTNPIQWFVNDQPEALPPWFAMHRLDARHFSLWDFNSDPETTPHNFVVSVFYDGNIFSTPDPTIINDPPGG